MSQGGNLRNEVAGAAERFVPAEMAGTQTEAQHVARYLLAASLAAGRRVLDAGCGVGYGAKIISAAGAASVVGVDLSADAIAAARALTPDNTTFVVGDLRGLDMPSASFDLVVCFEVLEHIVEQEAVMDELARLTAPGGVLLASSPNRDVYLPGNPHHIRELVPEELLALVAGRFPHVELLRQHDWVTSAVLDDNAIATADVRVPIDFDARKAAGVTPGEETFTVAMASASDLTEAPPYIAVLGTTAEIRRWQEDTEEREATLLRHIDELRDAHAQLMTQLLATGDELQATRDNLAGKDAELAAKIAELGAALNEVEHLRGVLRDMKASASWRVTTPLRALKRAAG